MVRESGKESGEEIEEVQCTWRAGKSDLNAKFIHQMRHNTQVKKNIFSDSNISNHNND